MRAENLMIVQGGGPTAVFNASLASILAEAMGQPRVGKIFGARSGMQGLAAGDVVELSHLSAGDVLSLRHSPGAGLGSSRFKPTEEDLTLCVAHLRRLDVRHLVFMGGNGTMQGAEVVRRVCAELHYEVQIMGVPKTIDNDLAATDRCPGFASAARFVAQSTLDLAMDIRSLPQPVSIFETLGRDVGWLAASSTLARVRPDDAPHLVYVPETPFHEDAFLSDLDAVVRRVGWAVVIVSEGIMNPDGTPVFEQKVASPHHAVSRPLIGGVAQHLSRVVAEKLGIRCRSEKPGLIGRSCMALVSVQDREDAALVGRESIRALMAGRSGEMVALRSLADQAGAAFQFVPLSEAAGPRRAIPTEWLSGDQGAVNEKFRQYMVPLLGALGYYPPPLSALPRY